MTMTIVFAVIFGVEVGAIVWLLWRFRFLLKPSPPVVDPLDVFTLREDD
jgi:hypothetical protein